MKTVTVTDAQRHRWDVNLTRKNRCKKIREISLILGAAALLLTLLHLIIALPAAASGNRRVQIAVIACALMCITLAPGIWKQYLPLMIACAVLFLCCTVIEGDLFHPLVPPALAAVYDARREDLLLRNEEAIPILISAG